MPGMGLSAIKAEVAPKCHDWILCGVAWLWELNCVGFDGEDGFDAVPGTHPTGRLRLRQQGAGSAAVKGPSSEKQGAVQAANEARL